MIGTVGMLEIEAKEKHFLKLGSMDMTLIHKGERMSTFNSGDYLPGG